ncbi:hypothetical protein ABH15_02665 [Methanoculleus taiwanensis]|uniref:Uncharacterized protein n=1 Tax=Methanoculleus taiwanensis TaxID=1550565 RepID=A0A498H2B4_9EURY|nr:hypothetical protein ABH15_02665 [Methanoculleus taiwanensis]
MGADQLLEISIPDRFLHLHAAGEMAFVTSMADHASHKAESIIRFMVRHGFWPPAAGFSSGRHRMPDGELTIFMSFDRET